MEIYLGEKGLKKGWQEEFTKTTKCHKCKKEAKIMFVGCEYVGNFDDEGKQISDKKEKFICDIHKTTGKKGGLWFHDAVAIAVYACPHCLEITALANQA